MRNKSDLDFRMASLVDDHGIERVTAVLSERALDLQHQIYTYGPNNETSRKRQTALENYMGSLSLAVDVLAQ